MLLKFTKIFSLLVTYICFKGTFKSCYFSCELIENVPNFPLCYTLLYFAGITGKLISFYKAWYIITHMTVLLRPNWRDISCVATHVFLAT